MSRTVRGEKLRGNRHSKRNYYSAENEKVSGFAIFRPLNEEQASDIRLKLIDIVKGIPSTRIRGFGDDKENAGVMIVGKYETKRLLNCLKLDETSVLESIHKYATTLNESATMRLHNIGRFGSKNNSNLSISACFDETDDFFGKERGDVQTALCELNGWNPIDLLESRQHVSFVQIPRTTELPMVNYLKREITAIVPEVLKFEPGRIII